MPRSIRPIQAQLGCLNIMVALDGALVVDGCYEETASLVDRRLPPAASVDIVRMAIAADAHVGIFRGDEWVVGEIDYWARREIRGNKLLPQIGPVVDHLRSWIDARSAPHKIMIRGSTQKLRALRQAMAVFEDEVLFSFGRPTAIEIVSRTAGKWSGVKFVLDRIGISAERVMAFGDSDNDLELLRSVGHSVAPTNASGRAREVAREITLSNVENGVAVVLSKYFPKP